MVDFEHARKAMVDNQLRPAPITDRRLLLAMGDVPRQNFVPEGRQSLAYIDDAHVFPGPMRRTLAAPAPFARLLQLAELGPEDVVLDVGCTTGYSSAVIAELAGYVVALEADTALAEAARTNLAALNYGNSEVVTGPLDAGAPKSGQFDVIVLEGAVAQVPGSLLRQLKEGGRLVTYVRTRGVSVANLFVRRGNEFQPRAEFDAAVPMLLTKAAPEAFVF